MRTFGLRGVQSVVAYVMRQQAKLQLLSSNTLRVFGFLCLICSGSAMDSEGSVVVRVLRVMQTRV